MEKRKKKSASWAKGCSIGCLTMLLLFCLFIFTMCHVPKAKYEPYISSGETYYRTVLGITPKVSHDLMYADEGGGFAVRVSFTKSQSEGPLTKLYMKKMDEKREYSFRGSSTESNIVGLSEKETNLLERSNEYFEFNRPVAELLDDLLEDDSQGSEKASLTNGGSFSVYSTDLNFWKRLLANDQQLKAKSFKERMAWLSSQTDQKTYFYIKKEVSLEDMSAGMLHKIIQGEEEDVSQSLVNQTFTKEVIQNFPVGSIFELRMENQQSRTLYESDEKNELVNSRYEYPVTY
ncbi:hypothetical protein IGI39_004258 [Enterococcus sp. AZ135]|uniref:hypothetical protein n=1 Tax=unclassified Enterococcus TaxID=2608891 RepID=UPI003F1ECDA5